MFRSLSLNLAFDVISQFKLMYYKLLIFAHIIHQVFKPKIYSWDKFFQSRCRHSINHNRYVRCVFLVFMNNSIKAFYVGKERRPLTLDLRGKSSFLSQFFFLTMLCPPYNLMDRSKRSLYFQII